MSAGRACALPAASMIKLVFLADGDGLNVQNFLKWKAAGLAHGAGRAS